MRRPTDDIPYLYTWESSTHPQMSADLENELALNSPWRESGHQKRESSTYRDSKLMARQDAEDWKINLKNA